MNKIFDNKQEFTELYRDAVMSISGKSVEAASDLDRKALKRRRWLPLDGPPARKRALAGRLAARAILFVTHIDKPSEPHRAETLKYTDAETSEHRHSLKKERNV